VSGLVYLVILKLRGATEEDRNNIKEAKPDTVFGLFTVF